VCCSVLQCDAVCCSVLQCVAVCCSVMQCAAVCWEVLQCVAVCCSVLQCVAVCFSTLQCAAVCHSVWQCLFSDARTSRYSEDFSPPLSLSLSHSLAISSAFSETSVRALLRSYGVSTISRLLKIIGLSCRISSLLWALLQKRPIILRSPLIVATPYHCFQLQLGQ